MNAVNKCFYPLHVDESGKLNPSRITLIKALSKGWYFFRFQSTLSLLKGEEGSGSSQKVDQVKKLGATHKFELI